MGFRFTEDDPRFFAQRGEHVLTHADVEAAGGERYLRTLREINDSDPDHG